MALVEYLVARDGPPPRSRGLAYDYLVGGDEFAVLLPDTDAMGAHVIADRIRCVLLNQPPAPAVFTVRLDIAPADPLRPAPLAALLVAADRDARSAAPAAV